MSLFGPAVFLAAAAAASAATGPSQNVLVARAFKENCADLSSQDVLIQRIVENGWSEVATDSNGDLKAFVSVNNDRPGITSSHRAFTNEAFPEVITVTGVTSDNRAELIECHTVLFMTTDWPDDAFFAELPGRLAHAVVHKSSDAADFYWSPGVFEGQRETSVVFLPADSSYRDRISSIGLMIMGRSYPRSLLPPVQIQE